MTAHPKPLRGPLIVSCQAPISSPLHGPASMAMMALAASAGGASGIRAEGAADIAAIKASVGLPVLGLVKRRIEGFDVYITPEFPDAAAIAAAGADAIAIDATRRDRPGGSMIAELIRRIRGELGLPVVADIDTLAAAVEAAEAGATYVATTLAGHTAGTRRMLPDIELVAALRSEVDKPILAEGGYRTPEQVRAALQAGALAVVVGEAITDPVSLTRRLVDAASAAASESPLPK